MYKLRRAALAPAAMLQAARVPHLLLLPLAMVLAQQAMWPLRVTLAEPKDEAKVRIHVDVARFVRAPTANVANCDVSSLIEHASPL
jgi:hypothetical protein